MNEAVSKKSDLGVRTLSAIVMLAVAGGALWLGGWWWGILSALVGVGVFVEWQALVSKFTPYGAPRIAWLIAGLVYISVAAVTLVIVRTDGNADIYPITMIVGAVIAVDIGAYFAGRTIGGPKIAPSISPSKTWAGLIGGSMGAAIVFAAWPALWWEGGGCLAYHTFVGGLDRFGFDGPCSLTIKPLSTHLTESLLMGGLFAIVAQAGDFFESWMKRRAGVKDSGKLIPGHGGLFDRVDGLMAICFVIGLFEAAILIA